VLIAGGAEGGERAAGWGYDKVEEAVSGKDEEDPRPRPIEPLVPIELLRDDIPPLKSTESLGIENTARLRPLDRVGR